jgi:hypothetical protein
MNVGVFPAFLQDGSEVRTATSTSGNSERSRSSSLSIDSRARASPTQQRWSAERPAIRPTRWRRLLAAGAFILMAPKSSRVRGPRRPSAVGQQSDPQTERPTNRPAGAAGGAARLLAAGATSFSVGGVARRRRGGRSTLPRAHEGRAGLSAVDSASCWGRLGGAVAAGRRRIRFWADDDVMLRPPRRRRATGSSPNTRH